MVGLEAGYPAIPFLMAGAATVVGVAAYGIFSPRSSLFTPVIWKGDSTGEARVALTFDDGPHPACTPAILAHLREADIRASFFVVGQAAEKYPEIVESIARDGHLIGNHSYDHAYAGLFHGVRYWLDQLERTDDLIEKITGRRPTLFRPPMGFKHHRVAWAVRNTGHVVVTWSRRSFDGLPTKSQQIVRRLVTGAAAGDILLLHDGAPPGSRFAPIATAEALPAVIKGLQDRGLAPARLDELIDQPTV